MTLRECWDCCWVISRSQVLLYSGHCWVNTEKLPQGFVRLVHRSIKKRFLNNSVIAGTMAPIMVVKGGGLMFRIIRSRMSWSISPKKFTLAVKLKVSEL